MSWFHKEHEVYWHIPMSLADVGIIFSIGFVILEINSNNLSIITNNKKQRIHAMYMHDSDCVMICNTAITSI